MAGEGQQPAAAASAAEYMAQIAAGGGQAAAGELPSFIGVPKGYTTTRSVPKGRAFRKPGWSNKSFGPMLTEDVVSDPQYYDGMQYDIYSWSPDRLAELQRDLAAAGLLRGDYRVGYADAGTLAAYEALLGESNRSGFKWHQQLAIRKTAPEELAPEEPRDPFKAPTRLKADPAALRQTARTLAKQVIGKDRNLTDDELDHIVGAAARFDEEGYQSQVAAARADYEAGGRGAAGGATVVDVDPGARLEEYLADRYAPEIGMRGAAADLSENQQGLLGSIFNIDQAIGV